ncbi:hypothetical protein LTR37_004122 [Vermiconidia calcicola]|uniref:Uncharacterized protein n=1 Tax=Vermiconidia calcicola TaxID=1690605 RepID=A0ACC3NPI7_9PEZI|nr:hypothetical protein LTR37_004122 [Vermiconidia calcicola]
MHLLPLYGLEQTKAAILRHAFETAKRLVRHSSEHPLEVCLATPHMRATGDDDRARAYSIAFVYQDKAMPRNAFDRRDIVTKTHTGEVWVDLKQNNILTMLAHLAEGRGKFVVKVWMYSPKFEKQARRYGSYFVGENLGLHYRACDAGSSAGGSGVGSGAGSAGSDAGSGAGSGIAEEGLLPAARPCAVCHGGHSAPACGSEEAQHGAGS